VAIISCAPSFAWLGLGGQRTPCFWASQRVEAIAWRGRTRHPPIRAEGKSWLWPADHTSCCVAKARVATSVVWQHGAPFVAIRWAALHALLMKELKAEGVRCVCSFLDTCISSRRSRVPYQRSSFSPCRFGGNGSTNRRTQRVFGAASSVASASVQSMETTACVPTCQSNLTAWPAGGAPAAVRHAPLAHLHPVCMDRVVRKCARPQSPTVPTVTPVSPSLSPLTHHGKWARAQVARACIVWCSSIGVAATRCAWGRMDLHRQSGSTRRGSVS
jgi:hypothetical protein